MSQRTKTITTYLALSSLVLKDIRSIEEQHNLEIALTILLSKKEIIKEKNYDGLTVFRLAA